MIYLNNNASNNVYLTLTEGCLSGGTEGFLFSLSDIGTNKSIYFLTNSASTTNNRFDKINISLTGTNYTYMNGIIPTQDEGQYFYNVYEVQTGVTTGVTISELSGQTIDFSTACTSTNIIESGLCFISGTTNLNAITKQYSATTIYKSYK